MSDAVAWPLALGVLGAIVGSFLATLVVRWPEGRSAMRGRSNCDGCGHVVAARDLVPLASAAILRGRCRYCHAAIDPRHWQIEAAAVLIGSCAGIVAPDPAAIGGAVFGWLLLTLAALDVAAWWLPDRLTATLAGGGLVTGTLGAWPPLIDRIAGGLGGFAALWLIATAYRHLRGRDGMGGGDPKLVGGIGLWLGWRMLPAVLVLACLIGLALVAIDRLRGRVVGRDTAVPFGALLAAAAYPAWLAMIASAP